MAFPLRTASTAAGAKAARQTDRKIYAALAAAFALVVFAGFARTYYLKWWLAGPPLPSTTVHVHGAIMTSWVVLFAVQVGLISSRQVRLHQRLGYASLGLAVPLTVSYARTGAAGWPC